jgi:hypothetical protein
MGHVTNRHPGRYAHRPASAALRQPPGAGNRSEVDGCLFGHTDRHAPTLTGLAALVNPFPSHYCWSDIGNVLTVVKAFPS